MPPEHTNKYVPMDEVLQDAYDTFFDAYRAADGSALALAKRLGYKNHTMVLKFRSHKAKSMGAERLAILLALCDPGALPGLDAAALAGCASVFRARLSAVEGAPDSGHFKRSTRRPTVARLFPNQPLKREGGGWIKKVAKLAEVPYEVVGEWHVFVQAGPCIDDVVSELATAEQHGREGTFEHNTDGKQEGRRWAIEFTIIGKKIVGYYMGSEDRDEDREVVLVGKLLAGGRLLVGQLADSEGETRRIVLARDQREGRRAYDMSTEAVA